VSYSPQPWRVRRGDGIDGAEGVIYIDASGLDKPEVAVIYGDENRDADARLIAAAPELLEAAKGLLESISGEVRDPLNLDLERTPEDDPLLDMKWIKALARAIAKAEGGE